MVGLGNVSIRVVLGAVWQRMDSRHDTPDWRQDRRKPQNPAAEVTVCLNFASGLGSFQ
jgi:hypothetical protein